MKTGEIYNCHNKEIGLKHLKEFPIEDGYVRIYNGDKFDDVKISEFKPLKWKTEKDSDGNSYY